MTETAAAERAIAGVKRNLAKYGTTEALRSPGVSSGPAHNPTVGSPTSRPCQVLPVKWGYNEVDGARILATDTKFAMEADGLGATGPNLLTEKLVVGTPPVAYTIVKADPVRLQGQTVLWWVQARA